MARQGVEEDHIPFAQCRHRLGFDIEGKHLPMHRAVDHPRGIEAVLTQGTDECLAAPLPERHVSEQARPPPRGAQPVVLALLVLFDVSSINASLSMAWP